jgi:hypothetical protein
MNLKASLLAGGAVLFDGSWGKSWEICKMSGVVMIYWLID